MRNDRVFTPRHEGDGNRVRFTLSPEEKDLFDALPQNGRKWVTLIDREGRVIKARRASCGAPCRCDAVFRYIGEDGRSY